MTDHPPLILDDRPDTPRPMTTLAGAVSTEVPPSADLAGIVAAASGSACEYVDGRLWVAGVTQAALNAAVASVGTASRPAHGGCTPREFRQRFTAAERGALTLAASRALEAGDPALQVFLDDLHASQTVELDHPDLIAGMDAIVAADLITRARADAILAA